MYLLKMWEAYCLKFSTLHISPAFFSHVKQEYSCVWMTGKEQATGKGKLFILLYITVCLSKESSLYIHWRFMIMHSFVSTKNPLYNLIN